MTPDELYNKLLNTPVQQRADIAKQIIAREDCNKYHFGAYSLLLDAMLYNVDKFSFNANTLKQVRNIIRKCSDIWYNDNVSNYYYNSAEDFLGLGDDLAKYSIYRFLFSSLEDFQFSICDIFESYADADLSDFDRMTTRQQYEFSIKRVDIYKEIIKTQKLIVDISESLNSIASSHGLFLRFDSDYLNDEYIEYSKHMLMYYLGVSSRNVISTNPVTGGTIYIGFNDKDRNEMYAIYNSLVADGITHYVFKNKYMYFHSDSIHFSLNSATADLQIFNEKLNQTIKEQRKGNTPLCPTCGSSDIHKFGFFEKGTSVGFFGIFSPQFGKTFRCKKCGFTW